jgi:FkbM family methyltransferase
MLKSFVKTLIAKAGFDLTRNGRAQPPIDMRSGLASLQRNGIIPATVLDVGASDGQWSELALQFFPNASYVLFEPQPVHASALERYLAKYATATRVLRKAVGRTTGSTFFEVSDPFGGALAHQPGPNVIEVPIVSLDDAVAELQPKPPYLIKLDTHGYEYSILEGASESLRLANALVIEAYNHKRTNEGLFFWELCAYLYERGFRPIEVVDVGRRPRDGIFWQMDIFFARTTWSGFDFTDYE